jgi:hypothetical protein
MFLTVALLAFADAKLSHIRRVFHPLPLPMFLLFCLGITKENKKRKEKKNKKKSASELKKNSRHLSEILHNSGVYKGAI